jgi:hypothetical protein
MKQYRVGRIKLYDVRDYPITINESTTPIFFPPKNYLEADRKCSVGCGMMVVSRQSPRHKMWTEITRRKYEREGQRYASDVTDAEWALIEPHMPAVKRLGRPRETELRAVLDAILYIARTGCQWRMLPKDFPPFTTVQGLFLRLARRRLV